MCRASRPTKGKKEADLLWKPNAINSKSPKRKKLTTNHVIPIFYDRIVEIRYAQKDARPSKSTSDEIELRRTTSRHYFYF